MATKKVLPVYRYPGKDQLTRFLKENRRWLNLTEIERMCNLPSSTMRHICAGSREMKTDEYNQIKKLLLPKLCEFVCLLQFHD